MRASVTAARCRFAASVGGRRFGVANREGLAGALPGVSGTGGGETADEQAVERVLGAGGGKMDKMRAAFSTTRAATLIRRGPTVLNSASARDMAFEISRNRSLGYPINLSALSY